MRASLLDWAYRRLGRHYPHVFVALELQAGFLITAGTVLLLGFYYEGSAREFGLILAVTLALTAVALAYGYLRITPKLKPVRAWIEGERSSEATARAWAAAVALPVEVVRTEMLVPAIGMVIVPGCTTAVAVLGLGWTAIVPLLGASLVAAGYGAILHYLTVEAGMRPVLIEINRAVAPRLRTPIKPVSLRFRLLAALPMINVITGLLVAALTGGDGSLGAAVLIAIGVATTVSLELTVLLSRSILSPLRDLQRSTEDIRRGDLDTSVPITTVDEIGELATSFNQMVEGLRERERLREAFGTYLDREVADYILSEGFDDHGVETQVSVLFCDVRDFTAFAADADAREVVACLNDLFEVVVPIIAAEGGHVDKFEGDGLMAVFGAPEPFADHAGRAVRAGLEIVRRVNVAGEGGPFEVGVGVNSGSVVAGSVGGGGRLNFSVIGDAVNVAARVQVATRQLGDPILIAAATRAELDPGLECAPRGRHRLKGLDRPVELFAPALEVPARERPVRA